MTGGWLDGVPKRERKRRARAKKEAEKKAKPVEELEDVEEEKGLACVAWIPIRCPHCASKHQNNYKTRGRLRYHLCQDCGERFKSLEIEAPRASGAS